MYKIHTETPEYVVMSSDFSQQEPRLLAFCARSQELIEAFKHGRDIYSTIAAIAYNMPYEKCLEFNPYTGEYQPDGKARRSEAKTIVLGIAYGRSVPSIGEQLFSHNDEMSDEDKTKEAQRIYDSVMKAFPELEALMKSAQAYARKHGYTETILGRRRHLPDMTLPEFEFKPLPGYVNPDIDPLDLSSLENAETGIPESRIKQLEQEFHKYKYFGQIARRTKELYEKEHIRVINNRPKINDARRQCVNCVDDETEILTLNGWKTFDKVSKGDEIISYNLGKNCLERDVVNEVISETSDDGFELYHMYNKNFSSMSTLNHRWVTRTDDVNDRKYRIYDTSHLVSVKNPRYQILRIADYECEDNSQFLGKVEVVCESIFKNSISYRGILSLSGSFAKTCYSWIFDNKSARGAVVVKDKEVASKLQTLGILAGKVCNVNETISVGGTSSYRVSWSEINKPYNNVARIKSLKKEKVSRNHVWCVSTNNGTWVARRSGTCFITGNSIIQGSAADFTKMALLKLCRDPRWEACGGEILTVVHDEIIAQAPVDFAEAAGKVLQSDMEGAGSFLPFPINCDVTTTYRWYGLEIPCKFDIPTDLSLNSENDISWVQWHLVEMGFELPNFKDKNGNDPIGDAAHGVSGQLSDEMTKAIETYCDRYHISKDSFIDDIMQRVETGIVERAS